MVLFSKWCFLVLVLVAVSSTAKKNTPLTEPVELPRLQWNDSPSFTKQLFKEAKPVILTNAPAHAWPLTKKWNPKYLSANGKTELGIKIHSDPKFPVGCCPLKPMSMAEFWKMARDPPKGKYMYLNAQVELIGDNLAKDIGDHFITGDDAEERMMNVWMGTRGTTAPLHHDPFENFFLQVYGRKRFYLFPPSEYQNLYLYPKIHAKHRQTQLNINEPDYERFPNAVNAKGIEVSLGPGDVMYLPPFWFHQVESLDAAISINSWYNNKMVQNMDEAWFVNLPLAGSIGQHQIGPIMVEYISSFVDAIYGPDSIGKFVDNIIATKYVPLYGRMVAAVDLFAHVNSFDDPHLRVHMREQGEIDASTFIDDAEHNSHIFCSLTRSETKKLIENNAEISEIFQESVATIQSLFLSAEKSLRSMHLEDYVEDLIGQTVGDKFVFLFLQTCFEAKN